MPQFHRTAQHEFYAFLYCHNNTSLKKQSTMGTLTNVTTHLDQRINIILDAIPEAKCSGVSVRYIPDTRMNWYVLRASYGREDRAFEFMVGDGTYAYVAKHYVKKIVNGKAKRVLENLIPNLLFVYTTSAKADCYIKNTPSLSFLSYYYNHFSQQGEKNPPLIVPNYEMENFILATQGRSEHLMVVTPKQCHFKGGETVRVIEGAFKGVEGHVARVAGQQRVVVNISNIGLVSTAYIPTAFLQTI